MTTDPHNPVTLANFASDFEAAALVNALAASGIKASTTGGFTAGFRAEAPGEVHVIVRSEDKEQADKVLDEFKRGGPDIDWSQVDVGDTDG
jgi:nitrogen regulatory protein PII-like uncharacterized protein